MLGHEASMTKGMPRSKLGMRCDNAKARKIASLDTVSQLSVHALGRSFLSTQALFYSGTPRRSLPTVKDLKVIDTTYGARMEFATGGIVFILIPRHDAIHNIKHVKKTVASLYALDNAKQTPEVCGRTQITVAEDNGKYATVGLKPNRGSTGVSEIWPKKLSIGNRKSIRKLMSRCEEAARRYLPSNELHGLHIAQLLGEWYLIQSGEVLHVGGTTFEFTP
jgi:hypothetical protein